MKTTKKIKNIAGTIFLLFLLFSHIASVKASDINYDNVLRLVNEERISRGIPKLKTNEDLNNAAILKSKDMINRNYFEHYAFGLSPWDFMKISGYDYLYAGENLGMDFGTAEGLVNAWMQSPKHRENILNPDYNELGLGVIKGTYISEKNGYHETTMVTNMFGRKKPIVLKLYDSISKSFSSFFN